MKIVYDLDKNNIGTIVLNNPPYNVLTSPAFTDKKELASFLADKKLKAVIIRGEGRNFSNGADLAALKSQAADSKQLGEMLAKGKELLRIISLAPVPVAAVIRGGCLGAGLELALACHFRLAAENALLGFPEINQMLFPGMNGTTCNIINKSVLTDLILSGKMISGTEALSCGLIDQAAPTREIGERAYNYLLSLVADKPAYLVRAAVQSIANSQRMSRQDAIDKETELFLKVAQRLKKNE